MTMTTVSWIGGSTSATDLCLLYRASCTDRLMDTAPDERQWQHTIEAIVSKPLNIKVFDTHRHSVHYSSLEKRDKAFASTVIPAHPKYLIGDRIVVRLSAIQMVYQVSVTLEDCEHRVYLASCEDEGIDPEPKELYQYALQFFWNEDSVPPTVVRYASEAERDEDAALLFVVMKSM
jgi:hypothetical protein